MILMKVSERKEIGMQIDIVCDNIKELADFIRICEKSSLGEDCEHCALKCVCFDGKHGFGIENFIKLRGTEETERILHKWIPFLEDLDWDLFACSGCGWKVKDRSPFCPNCGGEMEEG